MRSIVLLFFPPHAPLLLNCLQFFFYFQRSNVAAAEVHGSVVVRVVSHRVHSVGHHLATAHVNRDVVHGSVVETQVADSEIGRVDRHLRAVLIKCPGVPCRPALVIHEVIAVSEQSPVDPRDSAGAVAVFRGVWWAHVAGDARPTLVTLGVVLISTVVVHIHGGIEQPVADRGCIRGALATTARGRRSGGANSLSSIARDDAARQRGCGQLQTRGGGGDAAIFVLSRLDILSITELHDAGPETAARVLLFDTSKVVANVYRRLVARAATSLDN